MTTHARPHGRFWSVANQAFDDTERLECNEWHSRLWMAMDKLRDEVRMLPDDKEHARVVEAMGELERIVTGIPWLQGSEPTR